MSELFHEDFNNLSAWSTSGSVGITPAGFYYDLGDGFATSYIYKDVSGLASPRYFEFSFYNDEGPTGTNWSMLKVFLSGPTALYNNSGYSVYIFSNGTMASLEGTWAGHTISPAPSGSTNMVTVGILVAPGATTYDVYVNRVNVGTVTGHPAYSGTNVELGSYNGAGGHFDTFSAWTSAAVNTIMPGGYGGSSYGSRAYGGGANNSAVAAIPATLNPSGIASTEAIGSHTVTGSAATLHPGGIVSDETFGTATLSQPGLAVTLSPTGIASSETVGTAFVANIVSPAGIAPGTAGTPHIKGPPQTVVAAGGIATREAFPNPSAFILPPRAVINGVYRWQLSDPATGAHYDFALNPKTGGAAAEPAYNRHVEEFSMSDTGPVLTMFQNDAQTLSFDGEILTQTQYEAMWEWFNKDFALYLRDDLGRVQTIYITDYEPKRERKASTPYYHTYTVRYLLLASADI